MNQEKLYQLVIELLETEIDIQSMNITKRGYEIIDEVSEYAEKTELFKKFEERSHSLDNLTAKEILFYILDRIINAPTLLHGWVSIILGMPVL